VTSSGQNKQKVFSLPTHLGAQAFIGSKRLQVYKGTFENDFFYKTEYQAGDRTSCFHSTLVKKELYIDTC